MWFIPMTAWWRRGHGVFDTAKLVDGHVYELGAHLRRLHVSAGMAAIMPSMSEEQMIRTILETVAAAKIVNGTFHPAKLPVHPDLCLVTLMVQHT